ncbi:FAD-dependent oxidoreductase [Pseudonocardia sp. CA-107938]|uniref:FAD-dependent oxidoreductase n=1 Tax=Pseudonocardia sp. CA-107938 TaxID=3240021 RepID=UPI003D8DCC4E
MTSSPHVLVVGGGIGGLCLAHGLRRGGVPVTVVERTLVRTDWLQGYRIHISPTGATALHDCLAPEAWDRFVTAVSTQPTGMTVYTEQLRTLLHIDPAARATDPEDQHRGISRIALRDALLTGLDDVAELGAEFTGYTFLPDGRVRAAFADGTTRDCDLLVGADGSNSRVRRQLLPGTDRVDIGVTAIAGKHHLTAEARALLPAEVTAGSTMVVPPTPGFLFTAMWLGDGRRLDGPPADLLLDPNADYVFWAYADAAARMPSPEEPDGAVLQAAVRERISGWAPGLDVLVAGSDPATVNGVRVRSAAPVTAMPGAPVTLLGDAIHSMTPMAGIGANTALRDAATLTAALTAGGDLARAVAGYEQAMLRYGFAAVRQSLRNARMAASDSRLLRAGLRGGFRAAGALTRRSRGTAS